MRRYLFLILLCMSIVVMGGVSFIQKKLIPIPDVNWEYVEGDKAFEKKMAVTYSPKEYRWNNSFTVTSNGIKKEENTWKITAPSATVVESFYLENKELLEPFQSFFRSAQKYSLQSYFFDGTYLAYGHVKREGKENSRNRFTHLAIKVANVKTGDIQEKTYSLADLDFYEVIGVKDIQIIDGKLYVMLDSVRPTEDWKNQYRVIEFDVKTLKENTHKELLLPEWIDKFEHRPVNSANEEKFAPYFYLLQYEQTDDHVTYLIWDYKKSSFQELVTTGDVKPPTQGLDEYGVNGVYYNVIGGLDGLYLQKIENGVLSEMKLEGVEIPGSYGMDMSFKNHYVYLSISTEEATHIYVYNLQTGKKEYEGAIKGAQKGSTFLSVKN